jgi:hypothetical protein
MSMRVEILQVEQSRAARGPARSNAQAVLGEHGSVCDHQEPYRQEILERLQNAVSQLERVRSYACGDLRIFDSIEWHILVTAADDCAESLTKQLALLEADVERLRRASA